MDKAGQMEAFVRVVRAGNFSAAARAMKLSPSAISKLVSRIEEQLGVRLIDRSTRQIKLTPEGELYHAHAKKIVSDIETVEQLVTEHLKEPRGRLRVNATIGISIHRLQPLIPDFMLRHPRIEIDLSLSDEVVDLIEERAELAIRVGPLRDSSLNAKKICDSRRVVVASPRYLARHGWPERPEDLLQHNCLTYNFESGLNSWPFELDGVCHTLEVSGNFSANNGETLREMAVGGLGIARLGWFQAGEDIRQRRLVPLLEDFHAGEVQGLYAVHLGRRHASARVRCFIDFLVEKLGHEKPWLASEYSSRTSTHKGAAPHKLLVQQSDDFLSKEL
jgi:DNA-binding transcriptional LysR family regulator